MCAQLGENEASFSKYGWPDSDYSMSPAAGHLLPVEELNSSNENHHLERCALCGTYYRYDSWYEYYVNGSEDNASLLRLAPPEARPYISDEDYDRAMAEAPGFARSPDERLRRYGGACLASHAIAQGSLDSVRNLILHDDLDAAKGAVMYLFHLGEHADSLEKLRQVPSLKQTLTPLVEALINEKPGDAQVEKLSRLVSYLCLELFPA